MRSPPNTPMARVRFWARGSNSPSPPIQVTDGRPVGGAFSPDGRLFATAEVLGPVPSIGVDPRTRGEAHLIDVQSRRVIATLAQPPAGVWAVAFSPSGNEILLIDDEGTDGLPGKAFVIDTASRTRIGKPFPVITNPRLVAWSPDSHKIAVGGQGIQVIDMDSHDELWRRDKELQSLAWSPDGSTIATVERCEKESLYAAARTNLTCDIPHAHLQLLRSSDGAKNVGGWDDPTVSSSFAYSPDWSMIAAGRADGTVVLRNVATGQQVGPPLVAASNQPASVLFDGAGNLIVSTEDGGLWRWNVSLPANAGPRLRDRRTQPHQSGMGRPPHQPPLHQSVPLTPPRRSPSLLNLLADGASLGHHRGVASDQGVTHCRAVNTR